MVLIMVIIMVIIMIIIVIIMVIIMLNNFCFHVNAQKCQVVGLSGCQVRFLGTRDMLNININKGWSKFFSFFSRFFRPTSDVNISETGYPIYSKINVQRVASGDSLHFKF